MKNINQQKFPFSGYNDSRRTRFFTFSSIGHWYVANLVSCASRIFTKLTRNANVSNWVAFFYVSKCLTSLLSIESQLSSFVPRSSFTKLFSKQSQLFSNKSLLLRWRRINKPLYAVGIFTKLFLWIRNEFQLQCEESKLPWKWIELLLPIEFVFVLKSTLFANIARILSNFSDVLSNWIDIFSKLTLLYCVSTLTIFSAIPGNYSFVFSIEC